MKKLSAYTIARYCCDIVDVIAGIDEIRERIIERDNANKKLLTTSTQGFPT